MFTIPNHRVGGILIPTLLLLFFAAATLSGAEYDPRSYGAKADGKTSDTRAIQAAIDAATAAGGGTVVIRGGVFRTGTIRLKDNVTLMVAEGATLRGAESEDEYVECFRMMYEETNQLHRAMIFVEGAKNVVIRGKGTIHGSGLFKGTEEQAKHYRDRPVMIRIKDAENVTVRDVSLIRARSWTLSFMYCRNVVVDGVYIETMHQWEDYDARVRKTVPGSDPSKEYGEDGITNGDGIDIDGCEDVVVRNCRFRTHDDAVAIMTSDPAHPARNIRFRNIYMRTPWKNSAYTWVALIQGTKERIIDGGISFEGIHYTSFGARETQADADRRGVKEIGPPGKVRAETFEIFKTEKGFSRSRGMRSTSNMPGTSSAAIASSRRFRRNCENTPFSRSRRPGRKSTCGRRARAKAPS